MANSYVTLPGKDTGITSSVRQVIRQLRHDFEQETGNEAVFFSGAWGDHEDTTGIYVYYIQLNI